MKQRAGLAKRSKWAGRVVAWAVLLFMLAPGRAAWAHAILVNSTPRNGSVTASSFTAVLSFNSRIDQLRSRLTLDGPAQSEAVIPIQPDRAQPARLMGQITALKAGLYTLRWQVLAADGHITRGAISFRVK